jgi:hypothetical protein
MMDSREPESVHIPVVVEALFVHSPARAERPNAPNMAHVSPTLLLK